ncbi:MAG: TonB family protein [Ignavibacteriales bacterium]|jgi:protein TonB|nr:TonB family protein [Ignavibacteriales bacterium]
MFKEPRNISYIISILLHLLFAILFFFIKINGDEIKEQYVLIGFGTGTGIGSPSSISNNESEETKQPEVQKNEEEKKVELPKAKQQDENNVIEKSNKKVKEETPPNKVKPIVSGESKGKESEQPGTGNSGFGFELDFGGKGIRRISSYTLPEYPEGVSKEIDLKLRFTIRPDGTVGKIFPLIKADARLENAAINSLRQWRFEPLPPTAQQIEQTVVITFPFRLQ